MKKLLIEYSRVIGMTFTGLIFGFSFFLLFLNIYHIKEVNQTYVKTESDKLVIDEINMKLGQAQTNINGFNSNNYVGNDNRTELATLQGSLQICIREFENENIKEILNKKEVNIMDVYNFQKLFQNNILNECIVKQTYGLTETGSTANYHFNSLNVVSPFIKLNADNLLESVNYAGRIIENNSNYSFSSDYAKDNFVEYTRDNYNELITAYDNSAEYILYLTDWFKKMSGGII